MRRSKLAVVVVACTFGIGLSSCGDAAPDAGATADVIFFGDNIVTMDPTQPAVEAVAVRGETITSVGALDYVIGEPREVPIDIAVSNNFAFGGVNTSLVFKRWTS